MQSKHKQHNKAAPDNFGWELLLYVLCGIDNFNLIKQGSSLYFTNSNDCSFSKIRISYKKPVTENNAVTLKYISQESKETVGIYGDGILCCLVEFM
ncbi:MAG: hypothetical protein MRZ25_08375 [Ruminococcus sp.]|nr:hypothetical protein [Ruminococcus sp.]